MNRIDVRAAPSIRALMTLKDVTENDAREIRAVWHQVRSRSEARGLIDEILRTYGAEYLGDLIRPRGIGRSVYYCNAGDTYASTILFCGPRAWVGCVGDLFDPVTRIRS